ncbi:hypothetical protein AB4407_06750 [Vibrio sp. 10N.261.46.E11]|uniref:hypothetical protein n=1 Tax=Vibrio sp. 10N.261.46.E11 TaxID=3229662 RepID=UPI00354D455E
MNELTILLVVVLFPGVLLTVIYDNYAEHKAWDSFRYVLYSIVSGLIIYGVLQFAIFSAQFLYNIKGYKETEWFILSVWETITSSKTAKINPWEILSACFTGVILGLISVRATQSKLVHSLLIKLKITNKYGDDSVYIQTIESIGNEFVTVVLLDEKFMIQGLIQYYHDNGSTLELSMTSVKVFDTETGNELYEAKSLYIAKPYGDILLYQPQE